MSQLPAITGLQLIRLLKCDGWIEGRYGTYGRLLTKREGKRGRATVVPQKSRAIPIGTLMAILGPGQTALGKSGLQALIEKYGL